MFNYHGTTPKERAEVSRQFAKFSFQRPFSVLRGIMDHNEENIIQPLISLDISDAKKDLVPDHTVLAGMFGGFNLSNYPRYEITHSTIDCCEFVVDLAEEEQSPTGVPTHLLARLEKPRPNNQLFCSAAFQRIAHRKMPSVVPKVWGVGTTMTDEGVELHYLLSQYWEGAVCVEAIWEEMNYPVQKSLMEDVATVIADLQEISVDDLEKEDWDILAEHPLHSEGVDDIPMVGNSQVGWFKDMASFLMSKLAPGQAKYSISTTDDGSVVFSGTFGESRVPSRYEIQFTPENLAYLLDACALCHNDVEPRNIIIRPTQTDHGPGYELIAITNFDSAGFFPFAYETVMKDLLLGQRNRIGSWYDLYKEVTHHLLYVNPDLDNATSQEKLIKAVTLADIGQKQMQAFHVGNRVQMKWLEREGYHRGETAQEGFTRADDFDLVYTEIDDAELEEEALQELGYL
ncbi:hypothetical protein CkaCkLH20_09563 [Colletotrichum karsti]|uniref:Aminoglycoside phosphotransferase domain-containing protein n=1 Tax=Colletotrichum karsti TaxID=1095194 RepID=A0A9P6HX20_9PEZI|nr:uncharacterized protein CkaCkLH20_09563 [Colletotrichum karsti]KAF9873053.1 hypothetical protein CkaCkLH20_09563 [Colletotrichum karsti]